MHTAGEDPHWDLTSSRALLTSVANALRGQVGATGSGGRHRFGSMGGQGV